MTPMQMWGFTVNLTDPQTPLHEVPVVGAKNSDAALTASEVAGELAAESRDVHSYPTGRIVVTVWPSRQDQPAPKREPGTLPDDAAVFTFTDDAPVGGRTFSWAYRIEKTGAAYTADPDRACMSLGTRAAPYNWEPRQIADELADENRAAHSYYTGRLQVAVWLHNNEVDRRASRDARPPYDAYHFRYDGDGTEDAPLPPQPDDVDPATRAAWNAKTLGPAGRVDPAEDPNFRPMYFVGGPWHGETKYQARAFWPPQPLFVGTRQDNGEAATVSAPEREDDRRPRYRPGGQCDVALMIWYDPDGYAPEDLLLSAASDDPLEIAAFDRTVSEARQAQHDTPLFGGMDFSFQAAVAQAGRDFVAVALHRLADVLPGVTEAQRRFLDEASSVLGLEVVEDLTGANHKPGNAAATDTEGQVTAP